MIKKILPIIALIGTSALVVGTTNNDITPKKENFINYINSFHEDVTSYASVNTSNLTKTALQKYALSIGDEELNNFLTDNLNTLEEVENNASLQENENEIEKINVYNSEDTVENIKDIESSKNIENIENNISSIENNIENDPEIQQISTLYSLSNDIEDSCGDFCELKEDIAEAIVETQNLIKKVQDKELELSPEQRLFITEQAQQLKNLGRQLSNVTTELSFNLSDINQIMTANNGNLDSLSLKYLVVLDNLVNGNEMLQSGLSSLNLINQMFNMNNSNIPSNNQGRVLYGFQQNNNPPIVKDYYIDENGNMIENNSNNQEETKIPFENTPIEEEKTKNIDTYKNSQLNSNLDTYNNNNLPHNIDSFFNTALLDNDFMYGNGYNGYGTNGMYGNLNPYNQYHNNNLNNTTNSDNQNTNTQQIENQENTPKKEIRKKRLKKNIDTYKDENEPDIKTKLGNIKSSISNFFKKFKKSDLQDNIENPIYRADNEELKKN